MKELLEKFGKIKWIGAHEDHSLEECCEESGLTLDEINFVLDNYNYLFNQYLKEFVK